MDVICVCPLSHTKRVVSSRESISLASLTGQRVALEAIKHYGGADKVPVTATLIADHKRAYHQYQERLDKERKEKQRSDAEIRQDRELTRKREAEKEAKVDFETKKKKYETEESKLRDEIKFAEARLTELEERASNTTIQSEYKSALSGIKLLREDLRKKRLDRDKATNEKSKLVNKYADNMLRK